MTCQCDSVIRILLRRRFLRHRTAAGVLIEMERQTGLKPAEILAAKGHDRKRIRHILFQRLRAIGWSYPRIASYCHVHHATVMEACRGAV